MAHGYLGDGFGAHGEFDPDRGDEVRDRRERGWRGSPSDRGPMFGGWNEDQFGEPRRRTISSNPDDHYRSWRERHMSELDRDYEDYCREREERFHSEFNAWRRQRHGSVEPLRTGMTQTGLSADPTGLAQAEAATIPPSQGVDEPMADATLGTTPRGRGRS